MATATPWQLANAGQVTPVKPVQVVVFSHGTIGWPYQTRQIVVNSASYGSNVGVYGVNSGTPVDSGGGVGGGSTSGGSGGSGGVGAGVGTGGAGPSGFGDANGQGGLGSLSCT